MSPSDLLAATADAGLSLAMDHTGALRVRGPADALAAWAPAIRESKAELVDLLTPRRLWLIRHPDGRLVSHSFTPPATEDELRAWYPQALKIEPEPEPEPV